VDEHGEVKNLIREAYAPPRDITSAAMERIKAEERKKKLYLRMGLSAAAVVVIGCAAVFAAPRLAMKSDSAPSEDAADMVVAGCEMAVEEPAGDTMGYAAEVYDDVADEVADEPPAEVATTEAPAADAPKSEERGASNSSAQLPDKHALADAIAGMNGVLAVNVFDNRLEVCIQPNAPAYIESDILAMAEDVIKIEFVYE